MYASKKEVLKKMENIGYLYSESERNSFLRNIMRKENMENLKLKGYIEGKRNRGREGSGPHL